MAPKIQNHTFYRLAFVYAAVACLFALATATYAVTDTEDEQGKSHRLSTRSNFNTQTAKQKADE